MTKSDTKDDKEKLDKEMIDDLSIANNLYPVKKQEMLLALEKSLGIVTPACKSVGIARQTHYRWLAEDELYKQLVKDVLMEKRDFAETQLYKLVQKQNPQAVFYAMRINKDRGYSDSVELSGADREPIKFVEIKTYEKEE